MRFPLTGPLVCIKACSFLCGPYVGQLSLTSGQRLRSGIVLQVRGVSLRGQLILFFIFGEGG